MRHHKIKSIFDTFTFFPPTRALLYFTLHMRPGSAIRQQPASLAGATDDGRFVLFFLCSYFYFLSSVSIVVYSNGNQTRDDRAWQCCRCHCWWLAAAATITTSTVAQWLCLMVCLNGFAQFNFDHKWPRGKNRNKKLGRAIRLRSINLAQNEGIMLHTSSVSGYVTRWVALNQSSWVQSSAGAV